MVAPAHGRCPRWRLPRAADPNDGDGHRPAGQQERRRLLRPADHRRPGVVRTQGAGAGRPAHHPGRRQRPLFVQLASTATRTSCTWPWRAIRTSTTRSISRSSSRISRTHQADINVYESTTADDAHPVRALESAGRGRRPGHRAVHGDGLAGQQRATAPSSPPTRRIRRWRTRSSSRCPSGALGVQMQTGFSDQDVIAGVGGMQVTSPVPPGSHQFALSFQLPYSGSSADVSMQMPYPTGTYSVYLPDIGIKLDASGLTAGRAGPARRAVVRPVQREQSGQIDHGRRPAFGAGLERRAGPNQLALISLGVVLFVLGGGVLAVRRRRLRPALAGCGPLGTAAVDDRTRATRAGRAPGGARRALRRRRAEPRPTYDAERDRGKQRLRELTPRPPPGQPRPGCERAQRGRTHRPLPRPAVVSARADRRQSGSRKQANGCCCSAPTALASRPLFACSPG